MEMHLVQRLVMNLRLGLCHPHKYSFSQFFGVFVYPAFIYYFKNIGKIPVLMVMVVLVVVMVVVIMIVVMVVIVIVMVLVVVMVFMIMIVMVLVVVMVFMIVIMLLLDRVAFLIITFNRYNYIHLVGSYAVFHRPAKNNIVALNIYLRHFLNKFFFIYTKINQRAESHISAYAGAAVKIKCFHFLDAPNLLILLAV